MAEPRNMNGHPQGDNEMSLTINVREKDNVVILDINGRITLGEGSALLRDEVRQMLDSGHRRILLNLAEVSYIDSSGLWQLVGRCVTVEHRGGDLDYLELGQ